MLVSISASTLPINPPRCKGTPKLALQFCTTEYVPGNIKNIVFWSPAPGAVKCPFVIFTFTSFPGVSSNSIFPVHHVSSDKNADFPYIFAVTFDNFPFHTVCIPKAPCLPPSVSPAAPTSPARYKFIFLIWNFLLLISELPPENWLPK